MTESGTGGASSPPSPAPLIDRSEADGRLFAPTFERNGAPIRAALLPLIADIDGAIVEIGCGSGQHAAALAASCPQRSVLPTDIFAEHRASAAAHAAAGALSNVLQPIALDATDAWADDVRPIAPVALVLAVNVVHIAPWAVAQGLFREAGRALAPGGVLALYGPFIESDRPLADSNAAFDASLRARDTRWGIRALDDLTALANAAGLSGPTRVVLPANNLIAAWRRD